MSKRKKLYDAIMSLNPNVRFDEVCDLLEFLGFVDRQNGTSHRIYARTDIPEILNLQEEDGGRCKSYQIREIRDVFRKEDIHV